MTAPLRRWLTPVVAVIAALTVLAGPLPAAAAPTNPTPSGHEEDGEPKLLNDVIEQANRDYSAAKSKLDKSKKRQSELAAEVDRAKADLDALAPQVGQIAAQSYRTGRIGAIAMLLESDSPDSFVQRAAVLDEMNMVNEKKLAEVNVVKARAEQAKLALDTEVREQQKQTALMAKRKSEADKALSLVGGKGFTGGLVDATSPVAKIGPGRTADGDWKAAVVQRERPHHVRLHHPPHAARVQGGQAGRLQPVRRLLPARRAVGAPEGSRLRLVAPEERLLSVAQRRHPDVRQQRRRFPHP